MKLTLRRIREQIGWKRKKAAREFGIDMRKLKAYEEYDDVPELVELKRMLNIMGYNFDEIIDIIYADIERKYKLERKRNK